MDAIVCITAIAIAFVADGGAGAGASVAAAGFWTVTAGQLIPLVAALIAAAGVAATLLVNAANSRRQTLTTLYGDALGAVSEYLEGPYRVLRKDGEASTRFAITSGLSDVKTSIDHHQALLRLHADPAVADAYDHYVTIAKTEAGTQMQTAWKAPPVTCDEEVNLYTPLHREASDKARKVVVDMMQAHLRYRLRSPTAREGLHNARREVDEAIRQHDVDKRDRAAAKARAEARIAADAASQPNASRQQTRSLVQLGRRLRRRPGR